LISLWTTHLSVPLCKYAIACAIPSATLYLTDQGRPEEPLTPPFPFFLSTKGSSTPKITKIPKIQSNFKIPN
jgi:hypothetical protein